MVAKVSGRRRRCLHSDVLTVALGSSASCKCYLVHTGVEVSAGTKRDARHEAENLKTLKLNPAEDAGVPFSPRKIFKLSLKCSIRLPEAEWPQYCAWHTYLRTG